MEMTWHEYLEEVDHWKEAAQDRIANLTPAERAAHGQEAIAWLENKIGRKLPTAPPVERRENRSS